MMSLRETNSNIQTSAYHCVHATIRTSTLNKYWHVMKKRVMYGNQKCKHYQPTCGQVSLATQPEKLSKKIKICVYRTLVGRVNYEFLEREGKNITAHQTSIALRSKRLSEMLPSKAAKAGQNESNFPSSPLQQSTGSSKDVIKPVSWEFMRHPHSSSF